MSLEPWAGKASLYLSHSLEGTVVEGGSVDEEPRPSPPPLKNTGKCQDFLCGGRTAIASSWAASWLGSVMVLMTNSSYIEVT